MIGNDRLDKNVDQLEISVPVAIAASGTSPYRKNTAVNTEERSDECKVNDDSENLSTSLNITLPVVSVGKTKAMSIICRKESKGVWLLK